MDINNLLEQMLQTGKETARKGQTMAEQKLGIPESGEKRDAMMSGIKTGAAAAGVLALLLGTRTGRQVTGVGLKLGSLAALGGIAYQMYNQWQGDKGAAVGQDPALLPAPEQQPVLGGDVLLKAMVAAAKADGHVDEQELALIRNKLAELGLEQDVNDLLLNELTHPMSAVDVAALAGDDKKAALEIYLVSSMLLDKGNEAEKVYLSDLQAALGLPDTVVALS